MLPLKQLQWICCFLYNCNEYVVYNTIAMDVSYNTIAMDMLLLIQL